MTHTGPYVSHLPVEASQSLGGGSDPGLEMNSLSELARRVRTADVVDAMGRLHQHRSDLLDLVSPTPGRVLFGPAVTISSFPTCRPRCPRTLQFKRLFYEAIADGAEGCVSSWPVTDIPTPRLAAERSCRVSKTIGLQASSRTVDFVTSLTPTI